MTLHGAAPIAATVAALGVIGLMNAAGRRVRVASVALVLAGAAPLAFLRLPGLMDWLAAQPLLAAVGVLLALVLVMGAAGAFVRVPWLVVILGLVAGLRIPLNPANPGPTNHLVLLWFVVVAGLVAFAWRARSDDWPRPRLGAVGWALGAFVLLSGVSLFWSSAPEQGAYNFVAFYAPFGALVAMIGSIDVRVRLPDALGNTQVALGVLFAAVALLQLAIGDLFWNPDLIEGNLRSTYFRANSLFWDASALGRYEALAIITVLGAIALGQRRRSIGGAALLCAVLFAGLQLSFSRAGLAAVMFGVVLVAIAWRPRVAVPLGVAALAGVIAVLGVTGGVSIDRIFSGRSAILQQGVQIFEAAPIAGAGLGSYQSSHNVLLGIAAELGVIGLIAFLALAFAVIRSALRPASPARDRAFRIVVAIELLVIFAHSMVDAGLFDDGIAWALAAILAVIASPEGPPGAPVPARPAPVAAGPGAAAQP
jgi:O-antigen ligase